MVLGMKKIKLKDYISSDDGKITELENMLAVRVLWTLYELGGKGHISEVTQLVKENMVDSEGAEHYLDEIVPSGKKKKIDSNIAFARSKLRKSEILKEPEGNSGNWELELDYDEDNKNKEHVDKTKEYIRGLINPETQENTEKELLNYIVESVSNYNKNKNNKKKKKKQDSTDLDYENKTIEKEQEDAEEESDAEEKVLSHIVKEYKEKHFDFEFFCVELINKIDEETLERKWVTTQNTRDGGVDGIGYYNIGLLKFKAIMQVKIQDQNISRQKIVEFLGTVQDQNADKGIFITTSDFSKDARELAEKHNITIINGKQLARHVMKHFTDKVAGYLK